VPEQLTKHPDVTLQVLRSGELCVYGLNEATRMTQISAGEWQAVLRSVSSPGAPSSASSAVSGGVMSPGLASLSGLGLVLIGVAIGWILRRR